MDPKLVGNAMRRRMGAPSSHMGMAVGAPAPEKRIDGFKMPTSGHLPGVPDANQYSTGETNYEGSMWGSDPAVSRVGDAGEFASEVSAVVQGEPHPGRVGVMADTSGSARLTISPSMKIPQESPVPTQWQGRIVQSRPGRSMATFNDGSNETYGD
jgi:hypothetical protein